MLRKLTLAAVAAVSLGVSALAPTAASAHWSGGGYGWHGGGWHHHWGPRFVGGPAYYGGYGGCFARRWVATPWGPRWRVVNVCY